MFLTTSKENPVEGLVIYNKILHQIEMYTGTTWIKYDAFGVYCIMCQQEPLTHTATDHPFCKDNLEYLTWKYEQKELDKTR